MYKGTRCPVCGAAHAYVNDCPKYGVNVCGAHCEICEYRIGNLPISGGRCGYNASTKALKIPPYRFLAADTDIAAEISIMEKWSTDDIAERYSKVKALYNDNPSSEQRNRFRAVLAACDELLRDRADDVIAETVIPTLSSEDIVAYRKELCFYIAEDKYNGTLKKAVATAMQICNRVLNERIDIA